MSRFTEVLTVSPLADGRTWITRKEFGYDVGAKDSDDKIDVPIGFMTDFASVPPVFWIILPQWGKYGNAAVIHDFLYYDQKRSRKEADNIFLEAMDVLKVSWLTRHVMYWAVRWFGQWAWTGNQKIKARQSSKFAMLRLIKSVERAKAVRAAL